MAGDPNEERPAPPVADTFVPRGGTRRPVANNEDWASIARRLGIDPWDLIDYNFPGMKLLKQFEPQRASRQVNWYLREYVGCRLTRDGENWAFSSGLTGGKGGWKAGHIFVPPGSPPPPPPPPPVPHRACSPTGSGKLGRRPTLYRVLAEPERKEMRYVFGQTLPDLDTVAIGNGLGFDGRPWTDGSPMSDPLLPTQSQFQINIGDAAGADLSSTTHANCYVAVDGTLADLLVHEMTHVWQYHNRGGMTARVGVWISSVGGSYEFTAGDPWNDYDVEQQASIVEKWYHDFKANAATEKTHPLYPYVRLVVRSANNKHALRYAGGLTLAELARDVADLKARGLD